MGTFCYVVLCHTAPDSALALARRIRETGTGAHVLLRLGHPGYLSRADTDAVGAIRWPSRIRVEWGTYSLAEAQLEALAVARAATDADRFVVISGQDVPIRGLGDWEAEVRAGGADALLDPLADQPKDHEFSWRVLRPRPAGLWGDASVLRKAAGRAGSLRPDAVEILHKPGDPRLWVGRRRVDGPPPVLPVKAATWVTLSGRAVDAILDRESTDPALFDWFRRVRLPDEWVVPSVVASDPSLRVGFATTSAKVFPPGNPNPRWLDHEVLERIVTTSRAPFARKLAPDAAPDVIAETVRLAGRTSAEVDADTGGGWLRPPPWAAAMAATAVEPGPTPITS